MIVINATQRIAPLRPTTHRATTRHFAPLRTASFHCAPIMQR